MIKELTRKDLFEHSDTKLGPALELLFTKHFDRCGIEIKIDEMKRDGTQSCVVISRSVEKYVTEHALDHTQPRHHDEMSASARRHVA